MSFQAFAWLALPLSVHLTAPSLQDACVGSHHRLSFFHAFIPLISTMECPDPPCSLPIGGSPVPTTSSPNSLSWLARSYVTSQPYASLPTLPPFIVQSPSHIAALPLSVLHMQLPLSTTFTVAFLSAQLPLFPWDSAQTLTPSGSPPLTGPHHPSLSWSPLSVLLLAPLIPNKHPSHCDAS